MKIKTGYIPSEIFYTYGPSVQLRIKEWIDDNSTEKNSEPLTPAFIIDSEIELERFKKIAKDIFCCSYDLNSKKWVNDSEVKVLKKNNIPEEGWRFVGGLIYRKRRNFFNNHPNLISPDGFLYFIEEDVLYESIKQNGINPDGILNGKFLWANVSNRIKLIREDSDLYKALLDSSERHMLSSLRKKTLKAGTIYENRQGYQFIFLGSVTTNEYKLIFPENYNVLLKTKKKPTVQKIQRNQTLWFLVGDLDTAKNSPLQHLLSSLSTKNTMNSRIQLRIQSPKMVREIGSIELPKDIIEQVRQLSKKLILLEDAFYYDYDREITASRVAMFYSMRPFKMPCPEMDEPEFKWLEKYLGKELPLMEPTKKTILK